MRASLDDPALVRQAGRFVWLELDYDRPANQPFIGRRHVAYTPSLYVLDPATERATATHLGGMTLPELERFLDQGERGFRSEALPPADAALARGDEALGHGEFAKASAHYREALALAPRGWPERLHAVGSLTWSLWVAGSVRACAETAAVEAPRMRRDARFASVVLAGFASSLQGGDSSWARSAQKILEPLGDEAIAMPAALRDHRFQLYQQLIMAAQSRGDTTRALQLSHRWLDEIDAIPPGDDNERSALDIARVDALVDSSELPRVLAALQASEHAMPSNYNASLRRAQVEQIAGHYDQAIAACDRGLAHVTGPLGRSWLQRTRAEAMIAAGDSAGARTCLEQALESARAIGNPDNRDHNVARIRRELAALGSKQP